MFPIALTFDDVLLVPEYSDIESRQKISTKCQLTKNISLNIPLISSNMDTITEHQMCISMARKGGIGILHRYCSIEQQVEMVKKVKRAQNIIIENPYTINKVQTIYEALELMNEKKINCLLVIDDHKNYLGLIFRRHLELKISIIKERKLTDNFYTFSELIQKTITGIREDINDEESLINKMIKNNITKLPLLKDNKIDGLITLKDLQNKKKYPLMNLDKNNHLRVGAAVGVNINSEDNYLERSKLLIEAEVDILCIDIAHGHSSLMINAIKELKKKFPNTELIVGNVCSSEGYKDLCNAGADCIKVGIGSCFTKDTRILMASGIYKNICDIKIGDYIINKNGKSVKVLNVINQGQKQVSKVRFNNWHSDCYITSDHKFWIGDDSTTNGANGIAKSLDKLAKTIPKSSKFKWCEIGKMDINRMFPLLPNKIQWKLQTDFTIDLSQFVNRGIINEITLQTNSIIFNRYINSNYNLGYIFGTFLGDGCSHIALSRNTEIGSVRWTFNITEDDIANKLKKCIKNELNLNLSIKKYPERGIITVICYNKTLTKLLYKFGKRINKHLPEEYYCSNLDYIKGIYDGLIDSDGNIETSNISTRNDRIKFTNTSIYLIELFSWCCMNLQISYGICKQAFSKGYIKGRFVQGIQQAYNIKCHNSNRFTKDYVYSKILEYIPNVKEEEVWDIEVDCSTHSFIANNSIVHNSQICKTRETTGFGYPQLQALIDIQEEYQKYKIPIISDGGIKKSSDIVKALKFCDTVMLGSMFSGTDEAVGKIVEKNGIKGKIYRGMASNAANLSKQEKINGKIDSDSFQINNEEGIESFSVYKGSVEDIIDKLMFGVRSGISYAGGTLEKLKKNVKIVQITNSGLIENGTKEFIK